MKPKASLARLSCVTAALLAAVVAPAQEEAKKTAAAGSPEAAETAGSQLTTFGRQIPAQRPNRGIWIPSFSEGKLSSVVEADVVTRIDDQRLFAENMIIHLHNDTENGEVKVDMPSATYHMTSQMVRSNERSKVSRSDFDLEGDSLVFDTTTSQGRMSGNVRMTIHDARGFMKDAAVPAKEEKNAAAHDSKQPVNEAVKPARPAPTTPAPKNP